MDMALLHECHYDIGKEVKNTMSRSCFPTLPERHIINGLLKNPLSFLMAPSMN